MKSSYKLKKLNTEPPIFYSTNICKTIMWCAVQIRNFQVVDDGINLLWYLRSLISTGTDLKKKDDDE